MKSKFIDVLKRIAYFCAVWGKPIVRAKVKSDLVPTIEGALKQKGAPQEVIDEAKKVIEYFSNKYL